MKEASISGVVHDEYIKDDTKRKIEVIKIQRRISEIIMERRGLVERMNSDE